MGKAAVIAAALQLGFVPEYQYRQIDERTSKRFAPSVYRHARDWLVAHRSAAFSVADMTDGVSLCLNVVPEMSKLGITVWLGLAFNKTVGRRRTQVPCRRIVRLVRKGERSFHSDWGGAVEATLQAIWVWRRQDALVAEEAQKATEARERNEAIVAFLEGTELGFCPLITYEDSYAAGNCRMGTEEWVFEHGWRAKNFIPGPALIPHLEDDRVRRVVHAARQRRLNESRAIAA